MPTIDQKENVNKLRKEITTIEQFEAIGGYKDVAIKYHVGVMSAHGLMRSLKAKKAKEEKEVDNLTTDRDIIGPSNMEVGETANIVVDKQEALTDGIQSKDEVDYTNAGEEKPYRTDINEFIKDAATSSVQRDNGCECKPGEPCVRCAEALTEVFCSECGEFCMNDIPSEHPGVCNRCWSENDDYEATEGDSEKLSEETVRKIDDRVKQILAENEEQRENRSIEEGWRSVENNLDYIHGMYIRRAEREYNTRLGRVIRGVG